jgi:hypothetical protein
VAGSTEGELLARGGDEGGQADELPLIRELTVVAPDEEGVLAATRLLGILDPRVDLRLQGSGRNARLDLVRRARCPRSPSTRPLSRLL